MAGVYHGLQNLVTDKALKSRHVAHSLANHFAEGTQGKVRKGFKNIADNAATGAITPDIRIFQKEMHGAGSRLKDTLKGMSKRDQVGLRMLSEGRFKDLRKSGLDKSPKLHAAAAGIEHHTGFPMKKLLDMNPEQDEKMEKIWKSKDHPLASNIMKRISRGKPHKNLKEGDHESTASALAGSIGLGLGSHSAGGLSFAKNLASSKPMKENKYTGKVVGKLENQFIKKPMKIGWEHPGKDYKRGLKNRAYHYGVSPTSNNLKHTSSAISDVLNN